MRDRPFWAHRPIVMPTELYPLHCAFCQFLTGMYVKPADENWRSTDCSHCNKKIFWRIAPGDIHIIEKSTQTDGKLYLTGSAL